MILMDQVELSSKVKKQLGKIPGEVRTKLHQWVRFVEFKGLFEAQKFPGFKDHLLKGKRSKQRAVYLTKKWRVIYIINKSDEVNIIFVEEVIPHDY